jgi:hypothetical protein
LTTGALSIDHKVLGSDGGGIICDTNPNDHYVGKPEDDLSWVHQNQTNIIVMVNSGEYKSDCKHLNK